MWDMKVTCFLQNLFGKQWCRKAKPLTVTTHSSPKFVRLSSGKKYKFNRKSNPTRQFERKQYKMMVRNERDSTATFPTNVSIAKTANTRDHHTSLLLQWCIWTASSCVVFKWPHCQVKGQSFNCLIACLVMLGILKAGVSTNVDISNFKNVNMIRYMN